MNRFITILICSYFVSISASADIFLAMHLYRSGDLKAAAIEFIPHCFDKIIAIPYCRRLKDKGILSQELYEDLVRSHNALLEKGEEKFPADFFERLSWTKLIATVEHSPAGKWTKLSTHLKSLELTHLDPSKFELADYHYHRSHGFTGFITIPENSKSSARKKIINKAKNESEKKLIELAKSGFSYAALLIPEQKQRELELEGLIKLEDLRSNFLDVKDSNTNIIFYNDKIFIDTDSFLSREINPLGYSDVLYALNLDQWQEKNESKYFENQLFSWFFIDIEDEDTDILETSINNEHVESFLEDEIKYQKVAMALASRSMVDELKHDPLSSFLFGHLGLFLIDGRKWDLAYSLEYRAGDMSLHDTDDDKNEYGTWSESNMAIRKYILKALKELDFGYFNKKRHANLLKHNDEAKIKFNQYADGLANNKDLAQEKIDKINELTATVFAREDDLTEYQDSVIIQRILLALFGDFKNFFPIYEDNISFEADGSDFTRKLIGDFENVVLMAGNFHHSNPHYQMLVEDARRLEVDLHVSLRDMERKIRLVAPTAKAEEAPKSEQPNLKHTKRARKRAEEADLIDDEMDADKNLSKFFAALKPRDKKLDLEKLKSEMEHGIHNPANMKTPKVLNLYHRSTAHSDLPPDKSTTKGTRFGGHLGHSNDGSNMKPAAVKGMLKPAYEALLELNPGQIQ